MLDATSILTTGLSKAQTRLRLHGLARLEKTLSQVAVPRAVGDDDLDTMVVALLETLELECSGFSDLLDRQRVFHQLVAHAVAPEDRQRLLLDTARQLGARGLELWRDRRALSRWLDEVAINERIDRALAETQERVAFLCDRIGALVARGIERCESPQRPQAWSQFELEARLTPLLEPHWDERVPVAALECLSRSVRGLADAERRGALSSGLRQRLVRRAQDRRASVWRQIAALDLLDLVDAAAVRVILQQRLATPSEGDDLFVREHLVHMVGRRVGDSEEMTSLLALACVDPSPFVRQAVARQLVALPIDLAAEYWLELAADPISEVRGSALDAVPHLATNRDLVGWLAAALRKQIGDEPVEVVCRIGLAALLSTYRTLSATPELAEEWWEQAIEATEELRLRTSSTRLRRWAAEVRETLWVLRDTAAATLRTRLVDGDLLPPRGRTRRLGKNVFSGVDRHTAGRVLSVLAIEDFPLDLESGRRGDRLSRGFRFRFRLWRLIHEVRNPGPDKRQGFRHTIGRVAYGELRAPSACLAELAETKVPGEPLLIEDEGGWRPYLPLLDDFLSLLNQGLPGDATRFYSSEGVTEVFPPRTLAGRLKAYLKINWRFAQIAGLRNWRAESRSDPRAYVAALETLGFHIKFREHEIEEGRTAAPDETVRRHFAAAALPLTALPLADLALAELPVGGWVPASDLLDRFLDYSLSLYENSPFDLALFTGVLTVIFVGRHLWRNWSLARARARLGLVVGGWGTRGKSSVERLKAGVFNSMGFSVVSKTTGCEAMMLYGHAFGRLRELFLFRPYDKATIWEQRNLVLTAAELEADVFLWECMGLTPSYVDILQRQWMRDDLSTLTNTYPDHEDLQGPAGINIPEVMTLFIPTRGRLLSSEEQMLPILRQAASDKGTATSCVGWKEAALLPRDIMERFPYQEHPYNVALVSSLAAEVGASRAFALKEMADGVVPDLGVLKTYPAAYVNGRWLEFSNGMSANERHGCLGNWRRLGLDRRDPVGQPQRWTTVLVNNRADRIPRSKVFAKVIVEDLPADRYVLIGGNLQGMMGYIHEAWREFEAELTLWPQEAAESALQILRAGAIRSCLPVSLETVERGLANMLGDPDDRTMIDDWMAAGDDRAALERLGAEAELSSADLDAVIEHHLRQREALAEFEELETLVSSVALMSSDAAVDAAADGDRDRALEGYRKYLRRGFERKLIVIEDYYASGDEIVARLADETPPRFHNHVFGVQNIKGTGLDFVYRWLAWERCHTACNLVTGGDLRKASAGLRDLLRFQEYGLLSEGLVREMLAATRHSALGVGVERTELDAIEATLDTAMAKLRAGLGGASSSGGGMARVLEIVFGVLEDLLDAGDAVRRRKRADTIYRDLVGQRISTPRAALELQELTKRQKGGWLLRRFKTGRLYRYATRRASARASSLGRSEAQET